MSQNENRPQLLWDNEPANRSIEDITKDILAEKLEHSKSYIKIGRDLIEAKNQLRHGEWLVWLQNEVNFSVKTAQNYMKIANSNLNAETLSDLGYTKANALLSLPNDERENFLNSSHEINGNPIQLNQTTTDEFKDLVGKYKDHLKFPAGHELNSNDELDNRISSIKEHCRIMKNNADIIFEQLTVVKNACTVEYYSNLLSQIRDLLNDIQTRFPETESTSEFEQAT